MAECPFCGSGVSEDLITYGGTCPKCFAEIPGEEAPTDPGEEVRAAQERTDRRRSTLRAAVGLTAMLAVVSCTGLTAIGFALWPDPDVVEIVDFDELDFPMPEVIDGQGEVIAGGFGDPGGELVASSSGGKSGDGGGGDAGSTNDGSSGTEARGSSSSSGAGGAGDGGPGEYDGNDPRIASVVGAPGTAGANNSGRDGSGTTGSGKTDAERMAERFAPKGIDGGTSGIDNLGGDPVGDASAGLAPRGIGEGPADPTRDVGLSRGTGGGGLNDLSISTRDIDRDKTTVYEDRDAIIFMIGERMVKQIPGLNNCYERRLKVNESLQGRWRLDFTVTEDGSVEGATATGLNRRDAELEECITGMIESKWRFAKVAYDVPVRRTLTFRPN